LNDSERDVKQLTALKIITFALLVAAPVIYLLIAWQLDSKGMETRAGNELLLYILMVLAVTQPLLAPVVARFQTSQYIKTASATQPPAQFFVTVSVMKMAFVEAIYIYGLVVFILTGVFVNMLFFYPIGIVWSFVHYPRRTQYERLVEKLRRP
jgi:hypothetical protein